MGRITSSGGSSERAAKRKRPINRPSVTAKPAAIPKPMKIRSTLLST
jgi:hypothetical protein